MPIQYTGVLEEHRACREHAVVFDVSHLGSVRVHGAGAFAALQWAFTNDLDRIGPGRAQYTHLLDPDDAHVVDDIIVWWTAPGDFLVMPNASNTQPLIEALGEAAVFHGAGECEVDDVTADARGAGGPGSRGARAAGRDRARARRSGAVRGGAARVRRRTRVDRGHRLHRRGRRRAARARSRRGPVVAPPARRRHHAGGAGRAATPCASKRGCRCTGTSWARGSPRCRPASPGWCASTRATSTGAPRSRPSTTAVCAAGCAG